MTYLKPKNAFERPFAMILNRTITMCTPYPFSLHHTIVAAITLAVPLFPSQVKGFLHVPWFIAQTTI